MLSAFRFFAHLGDLTEEELGGAGPNTTLYVVQRDGTFVTQRDSTQVEDRRP